MKASTLLLSTALLCVLLSTHAHADGNELLEQCLAAEHNMDNPNKKISVFDAVKIGQCLGMVEGIRATVDAYQALDDVPRTTCFPEEGVKNSQLIRVVVKYLKAHPGQLHRTETFLILMAYMDAFPCK